MYGRKIKFVTDLKPLIWFQNSKDPCSRVTRWRLKLAKYDFEVVYKAGKTNVNPDALSRNPVEADMETSTSKTSRTNKVTFESIPVNLNYKGNPPNQQNNYLIPNEDETQDLIDLTCTEEINYNIIQGHQNVESYSSIVHEKAKCISSKYVSNMMNLLLHLPFLLIFLFSKKFQKKCKNLESEITDLKHKPSEIRNLGNKPSEIRNLVNEPSEI